MNTVVVLFPHQLFDDHPVYHQNCPIYLVEEFLFFRECNFHKIKLAYHRASMKNHAQRLQQRGLILHYIDSISHLASITHLIDHLAQVGIQKMIYINPTDDWLEGRIQQALEKNNLAYREFENALFINQRADLKSFFKPHKKSFFQTTFYKKERKRLNILVDHNQQPVGGKWSYDHDNRKKYPKNKIPPDLPQLERDHFWQEAVEYVGIHYGNNLGTLPDHPIYPYHQQDVEVWLERFLSERFHDFGAYEDALVVHHTTLHHSVLTPMLNIGLIKPLDVVYQAIDYAKKHQIPLNSLEGFVRQIIGWREFIRGMYEHRGRMSRTMNFWKFTRRIPSSFYDGNTGIEPVDHVIRSLLQTGYCHHIERLMVLGNFMLLCEFHPREVYRWFMELFIDAYDWVMVPNVYGMSQFADGGLFATKPYISSSNYVMKMSNYSKGPWQATWDALYWRFVDQHRTFFQKNHRLSMMVHMYDKMSSEKKKVHAMHAHTWFNQLS